MRECLYYSCPVDDGTVYLTKGLVYAKSLCNAGCGRTVIHPTGCDKTIPKVCYECTEWVENPLGSA